MPSVAGYDVFISYSHSQVKLARLLQNGLQGFAKPWYRLRGLRAFRDTANLGANPRLWMAVEEALKSSRWFLLLASADAARSDWVNREVEWWLKHRKIDQLLIASAVPGLVWEQQSQDWAADPPLPPALRGAFSQEPLWVDLADLDVGALRPVVPPERLAALAAPIRDVAMDTLIGEHLREYRRAWRLARVAIAVLTTLALVATVAFVVASYERDQAIYNEIVAEAGDLGNSNSALAAQLNLQAYKMAPSQAGAARLLNTENVPLATRLDTKHGAIKSVAVSGNIMAYGSYDGAVTLFDVTDPTAPRQLVDQLTGTAGEVDALAFSDNGRYLISGDDGGTIRAWRLDNLKNPDPIGNAASGIPAVSSVVVSPNGRLLAAGSIDGTTRLFDLTNGNNIVLPEAREASDAHTLSIAFNRSGDLLAVAKVDNEIHGTIELWNVHELAHPQLVHTIDNHNGGPLQPVAFSPDGHTLAGGSIVGLVVMWDVTNPADPQASDSGPLSAGTDAVLSLQFSPDGNLLAAGNSDGTIRLWDVANGDVAPPQLGLPLTANAGDVTSMAFMQDGHTLITGNEDGAVLLWHLPTTVLTPDADGAFSLDFSRSGNLIAIGSNDGPMQLWDVQDPGRPNRIGAPLTVASATVHSIKFSPDGRTLAEAGGDVISLWNVVDPNKPYLLTTLQESSPISAIAFGASGRILAEASGNGVIQLWNIANSSTPQRTGEPFNGNVSGHPVYSIALNSGGDLLASGGYDNNVRFWNVSDPTRPQLIGLSGNTGPVDSVAFSSDGRYLADADYDGTVHLWDISMSTQPRALPALTEAALAEGGSPKWSVAFSPDGHTIAFGGNDRRVHLWDISNPDKPYTLGPLAGQSKLIRNLAFSSDGRIIASESDDGTVYLWILDVGYANTRICSSDGNELTKQQWANYIAQLAYRPPCGDS